GAEREIHASLHRDPPPGKRSPAEDQRRTSAVRGSGAEIEADFDVHWKLGEPGERVLDAQSVGAAEGNYHLVHALALSQAHECLDVVSGRRRRRRQSVKYAQHLTFARTFGVKMRRLLGLAVARLNDRDIRDQPADAAS